MTHFEWVTLPGGLEVACQTATEARFFYRDIWRDEVYCRGGVSMHDLECVVDVGANVGLFSLFVAHRCPHAEILAFEPAPPLFEILCENFRHHGVRGRAFNLALAEASGRERLTFYPQSSGMSSLHADVEEEKEVLRAVMENQRREGMAGMEAVLAHAEDLLEERLREESFECRLEPLSAILRSEGIARVDLLKIDVQKAEMRVLEGIDAADWPKVRQVVVEVHDVEGRLERARALLERVGFEVAAEQDAIYERSVMVNLYGVRRPAARPPVATMAAARGRVERQRRALEKMRRQRPAGRGADGDSR